MSDLIAGHLVKESRDWSKLNELLPAIGYRVFRWEREKLWLVGTFPAGRSARSAVCLPLEETVLSDPVHDAAAPFALVADVLAEHDYAGAESHGTLNLSLRLAGLLGQEVFSYVSDTELLELAAICAPQRVRRVRQLRHDLEIQYEAGKAVVQPLLLEDALDDDDMAEEDDSGEDEDEDESVAAALRLLPHVEVKRRNKEWDLLAHAMVHEELERFLKRADPSADLALPESETGLELVAEKMPKAK